MEYKKLIYQIELSNTGENRDDTGREILTGIVDFLEENQNKKVAVFLHTSVVAIRKHNLQILKSMESDKVKFYIPENCIKELKLLKERGSMPVLRKKAANFLDIFGKSVSWSHYIMSENKHKVSSKYNYNRGLFVFCEPEAASEFSKRFASSDRFFVKNQILSYNPYITTKERVCFCKAGQAIKRSCESIEAYGADVEEFLQKNNLKLSVRSFDGKEIAAFEYKELGDMAKSGGEAKIYESSRFPGKIIKIYKNFPSERLVRKIYKLHGLNPIYDCCAFPTEIVYCGQKCVGFLMEKIDGNTIEEMFANGLYENKKKYEVLLNFTASLVEARINQLVVADLSPRNAIVRKDGRVVFIDVDSMEFAYYPGGSITPPYGHPGFDYRRDAFQRLRTLEETGFAYTVLLFWFVMGSKYPLHQCNVPIKKQDWNIHKFPYDNSLLGAAIARTGTEPTEELFPKWKEQPLAIRKGFIDIFVNKKTYDVGEWLKILNLIP